MTLTDRETDKTTNKWLIATKAKLDVKIGVEGTLISLGTMVWPDQNTVRFVNRNKLVVTHKPADDLIIVHLHTHKLSTLINMSGLAPSLPLLTLCDNQVKLSTVIHVQILTNHICDPTNKLFTLETVQL